MMNKYAFGCGGIGGLKVKCQSRNRAEISRRGNNLLQTLRRESILLTAASAQSVRLVMALSETGGSLRCKVVSFVDSWWWTLCRATYSF